MLASWDIILCCFLDTITMTSLVAGNVAYGKPATQSVRDYYWYTAQLAVDGNSNPALGYSHCSHSFGDWSTQSWWQVDLLDSYLIYNVTINNRDTSQSKYWRYRAGITIRGTKYTLISCVIFIVLRFIKSSINNDFSDMAELPSFSPPAWESTIEYRTSPLRQARMRPKRKAAPVYI